MQMICPQCETDLDTARGIQTARGLVCGDCWDVVCQLPIWQTTAALDPAGQPTRRTWRISVPGKPFGQPRSEIQRIGSFVKMFTPDGPHNDLTKALNLTARIRFDSPLDGPVGVFIDAVFPRLKTHNWAKRLHVSLWKWTKPDNDNISKLVCDALNRVAWHDDGQVSILTVRKRFAAGQETARTDVFIYTMGEFDDGPRKY